MDRFADALQRREQRSFVQVLAGMYISDADSDTERRANGLLGDDRPGTSHLSMRNIQVRARTVDFLLSRSQLVVEVLSAVEHCLGQGRLGLLRFEFGFLDGDIERHQQRAGFHDLSRREPDFTDRPGQFVFERDRAQCQDRTDRCGGLAMIHLARDGQEMDSIGSGWWHEAVC